MLLTDLDIIILSKSDNTILCIARRIIKRRIILSTSHNRPEASYSCARWINIYSLLSSRIQAFSFLCTFVPGSEKSTERTFAPVELSFRGTFASWNFRSCGTFVPWERTFQELSFLWNCRSMRPLTTTQYSILTRHCTRITTDPIPGHGFNLQSYKYLQMFHSIWAALATTLTTEFMCLLWKSLLVFVTWHDKVVCRRQQHEQDCELFIRTEQNNQLIRMDGLMTTCGLSTYLSISSVPQADPIPGHGFNFSQRADDGSTCSFSNTKIDKTCSTTITYYAFTH